MARILLINPIVREEDVPRHIPYGEALLAAIAIKEGHEVCVYDANAWRQPLSKVSDACKADNWDVIGIGGLTTTYGHIKKCCQVIKQSSPKSLLVAGGGFLTSMPLEIMEWVPEIDLGVVGEAFRTWPEILRKVDQRDYDFSETEGVVYRDAVGPVLNKTRPVIHNLDELPFPAWDLFPLEEVYFKNSSALYSEDVYNCKRRIDINGSYGCSLICRYCWHLGTTGDMLIERNEDKNSPAYLKNDVVFTYGRNIRYHSPGYIVEMVSQLKRDYSIDFANFLDENLMTMEASSGRKWLGSICDEWIKVGLQDIHWAGTSHASLYRKDTLKRMKEAGCSHLVYGIESYDPKILKNLGKGTTVEKNKQCIHDTLEAGIAPIPNIIIGFPEESFQSVRNTINALLELGIHAKPHFATAYPGSEWYYKYKNDIKNQYGGDLEAYVLDLGDATKITATISHQFTGVELVGLQECVSRRDLRLLGQFEANFKARASVVNPEASFNFRGKKIDGPMEVV